MYYLENMQLMYEIGCGESGVQIGTLPASHRSRALAETNLSFS
jgi:hypothetical protein